MPPPSASASGRNPSGSALKARGKRPRRTLRQIARGVRRRARRLAGRLRSAYRRSLQLRVVTSTLVVSMVVVAVLGVFLFQSITDAMIAGRTRAATAEAKANVSSVAGYFTVSLNDVPPKGGDQATAVSAPVELAARALAERAGSRYDVIILSERQVGQDRATGNIDAASVPERLRRDLKKSGSDTLSWRQPATLRYLDNAEPNQIGFVVGSLVYSPDGTYEIYHLFPLQEEEETLSSVLQLLIIVGAGLVLLLAAIASLVTRQVVTPVRLARQAAERLASGRLEERLKVRGEDDLARLATSFNEMASNLALKIHQLEELSQVQRQFVSDVSHELRTPLTTVRMAADLLYEAREDFDPMAARSAELMQAQLERFESMLADLLEISRYDAGAATLDLEPVDMRDVVLRAVGDSEALAERHATRFELRLPNEPCMADCDSRRVERILRNLLFNAIEHGEGKDIVVALGADRDAVAVAVRDHGVGLRHGEENMVFDRFWRADPSRARTIGGTGLGLAISREDAILHGGWLQAWGSPGEGTQFRLSLPRIAGTELRGSPLPLVPPEVEMRRTWRGQATPVLSAAAGESGVFDVD